VKYTASVLGAVWSLLNPVVFLAVFTFVTIVLGNNVPDYPVYLLSGLLAWNLFSVALGGGARSVVDNGSLVKKVYFPREILPLSVVGVALVDVIAGFGATVAILAALTARERTGEGQRIEIDLLSSALAALVNQASGYLEAGAVPVRLGNVHPSIEPFATYAAADGPLMICAGNDHQFAALAEAVEAPELAEDARFASNPARVEHRAALRELIEERLASAPVEAWVDRLRAAGVPAGPVNDIAAAFGLATELGLDPVDEHDGVRTVASPLGLRGTPAATRRRPPGLDEHGAEIRAWLAGSE